MEKVKQFVQKWQGPLGLGNWDLKVEFTEVAYTASCVAQPEYLTAILNFNSDMVSKLSDKELEETVVHEMLHAVIWPLANPVGVTMNKKERKVMDYFEELTVSTLTTVVIGLRNG